MITIRARERTRPKCRGQRRLVRHCRLNLETLEPRWPLAVPALETEVVVNLSSPVVATHAGDGSGRIFVAELDGRIRIVDNGSVLSTPFLNISSRIVTGNERGLLGLAFHPDYATDGEAGEGLFYVHYSAPATLGGDHDQVIAEYSVSAGNPDQADVNSERILLRFDHPFGNHNGGDLKFGPDDGLLYISSGDGGGGGDPQNNGQNLNTLLGKILRIDVDSGDDFPMDPNRNFAIPPTNPFANDPNARPEVFAYGLRNPFRMSFDDGPNGAASPDRLFVGDVGQGLFEEVDIVTSGGNYGWDVCEADHVFGNASQPCPAGFVDPIAEYDHSVGNSVIGGYVYRGSRFPELDGVYVFGDLNGTPMVLEQQGNEFVRSRLIVTGVVPDNIIGFGEDEAGELYILTFSQMLAFQQTATVDFGDAPASYDVTNADNGPVHGATGPVLGSLRDTETDGLPTAAANGDDTNGSDDEDGVTFTSGLAVGQAASIHVVVSAAGNLNAWIDFNRDGTFDDAGEQIFTDLAAAAGAHDFPLTVPSTASVGATYARFRLTTSASVSFNGLGADGEVEDYQVAILSGPDRIGVYRERQFREDANGNGQWNGALGGDRLFVFGTANDVPLAGDWNGDGFDEIGVQRGNQYYLDRNGNGVWDGVAGGDRLYTFRNVGDKPLVGDWDGDGDDEIGSWNAGLFYIDLNSNGVWDGTGAGDERFTFGLSTDTPLTGDWDGDGDDQIGVHRGNVFYLDVNGNGVWNGTIGGDRQITFGLAGDTPVKGDWDADGADDIGVRRDNAYYLDANGNGVFNGTAGGDLQYAFGIVSDLPLVGRWKANPLAVTGNDKLGVRRQAIDFEDANGNGELETAAEGDPQVTFGVASDVGIAGDWNGDGFDEIGVQRGNQFWLDANGNGVWDGVANGDRLHTFRNAGDRPLVGDWNDDADDEIGSWNAGLFYIDLNGNGVWDGAAAGDQRFTFGLSTDTPLAGDWNGDGDDEIGVHRGNVFYLDANGNGVWNGNVGGDRQITFGVNGDTPVTGDWDGDGTDEVGVKRNNVYYLDANGDGVFNGPTAGDLEYVYGLSSDQPLRAKWQPVGALMAAGGEASSSGDAAPLTTDELAPILQQAIILWATTGLNSSQLQTLSSVQVGITDLPGAQLGASLGGTILIDRNAAGYGWYVDLESEISNPASEIPASQSMDLLSVVLHELGHELGFDHDDDMSAMFETLAAGTRRML